MVICDITNYQEKQKNSYTFFLFYPKIIKHTSLKLGKIAPIFLVPKFKPNIITIRWWYSSHMHLHCFWHSLNPIFRDGLLVLYINSLIIIMVIFWLYKELIVYFCSPHRHLVFGNNCYFLMQWCLLTVRCVWLP